MSPKSIVVLVGVCAGGCFAPAPVSTNRNDNVKLVEGGSKHEKQPTIEELVKTIDDDPPESHLSYTPSVMKLVARGQDVIPYVIPLMLSDNLVTRLHAKTVLSLITMKMHGFEFGKGWSDQADQERWTTWWKSMGNYHEDADTANRLSAMELWKKWWDSRQKKF